MLWQEVLKKSVDFIPIAREVIQGIPVQTITCNMQFCKSVEYVSVVRVVICPKLSDVMTKIGNMFLSPIIKTLFYKLSVMI